MKGRRLNPMQRLRTNVETRFQPPLPRVVPRPPPTPPISTSGASVVALPQAPPPHCFLCCLHHGAPASPDAVQPAAQGMEGPFPFMAVHPSPRAETMRTASPSSAPSAIQHVMVRWTWFHESGVRCRSPRGSTADFVFATSAASKPTGNGWASKSCESARPMHLAGVRSPGLPVPEEPGAKDADHGER